MPESHTGANLARQFVDVVQQYGIQDKICGIVSDNASNAMLGIVTAAKELSTETHVVQSLRCIHHVLNLIAQAGFKSMSAPLTTLKAIVTKIRLSNRMRTSLADFCRANGEKSLEPPTDTPTRWNSTFVMVKTMLGMRKSVDCMRDQVGLELTPEDWASLEKLRTILEPFSVLTEELSGQRYCTLSSASFKVDAIWLHLIEYEDDTSCGVPEMISKLREYRGDILKQSAVATFLDPRFVDKQPLDIKRHAVAFLKKQLDARVSAGADPGVEKASSNWFEDHFNGDEVAQDMYRHHPELDRYTKRAIGVRYRDDPLEWWAAHEPEMPNLAVIARDHLVQLASSVPSEELFSAAGNTITETRTRLGFDTAEALLITQSWLKYQRRTGKN
jgi:hypothetical protein